MASENASTSSVMVEPAAINALFSTRTGANEVCVAANECVVAYDGAVFCKSVIVYGHRSAAEVDAAADVAVAHVCEVGNFCSVADRLNF